MFHRFLFARFLEERAWEMVNLAPGELCTGVVHNVFLYTEWREGRRRLGQVQEGNIQKGRGGGYTLPLLLFFLSTRETSDRGGGF